MRKLTYMAVFEPTETGYSVYFPELPGCVSCGDNFEAALKQAAEALELHIYGIEKDGEELPVPSELPQVDPGTVSGYILSPITIFPDIVRNEMDNKAVKTNLTLPAWLKEMAEAQGVNYSKLLQAALMDYLGISHSTRHDSK
ncbi:MAG: type II toxin-antitoxin system HicB family antitoxin [Clostridiaceae bacterium]|nr:type II toxin-antitoxin system HicB family antitoxin [Clostridiaceae bacterium]